MDSGLFCHGLDSVLLSLSQLINCEFILTRFSCAAALSIEAKQQNHSPRMCAISIDILNETDQT